MFLLKHTYIKVYDVSDELLKTLVKLLSQRLLTNKFTRWTQLFTVRTKLTITKTQYQHTKQQGLIQFGFNFNQRNEFEKI